MSSLEEVVGLVETLYSANPAVDVNQVQQKLQAIQKSNDGIQLANQLLTDPTYSNNVKYFGALTFTVQLNLNVESYDKFWILFSNNLIHLIRLCGLYVSDTRSHAPLLLTIKKLMSNLSLIFININEAEHANTEDNNVEIIKQWFNPINTFMNLFSKYSSNQTVGNNWTNANDPLMTQLVQQSINCNVSYDDLVKFISQSPTFNELSLIFTEIIIEDLTKYQSRKHNVTKVHEVVHEHLYISTMALLNVNITLQVNRMHNISKLQLNENVFQCSSAWINYISMTRHISSVGSMDLSEIFQNLLNLMCQSTDQTDNFYIAEKVLTILTNVFANDPTLMSFDLRQQVEVIFLGISRLSNTNIDTSKNAWMLQYMNHLVTHEMTDELKELAICIVDYLQISNLDVCNKLFTTINSNGNDISQEYIKVLLQMTNFPLIPVMQEFFSVRMVDFWSDLADSYVNLPNEALLPNSTQIGIDIFQQVINIYLPKISLENERKIIEEEPHDDSAVHEFGDFRSAVIDLSQNLWTILGNEHLTNMLVSGIGSSDVSILPEEAKMSAFYQIEAMTFIADSLMSDMTLSESPWILNILNKEKYFIANVLVLFQIGIQMPATDKAMSLFKISMIRSSSKMVGTLAGYLTKNETHLSQCVQTLFQGLESCSMNGAAANKEINDKIEVMIIKTISILCNVCRQQLSGQYLDHFTTVFASLIQPTATVSGFTRSRLAKSIGYIIECRVQNGPEEQAKYITQIIDMIENLIGQILESPIEIQNQRKDYVLNLLNCISEFGSALIHDEDYESPALIQQLQQFHDFWNNDPFQVRSKLLAMIEKLLSNSTYNKDSSFVEVCCLILGKALTLTDQDPHFLRYSMSDITTFMLKFMPVVELSSSLPFFIYLLEKMTIQFKTQLTVDEFDYLFNEMFIKYYPGLIERDPDLLQMMINFVITILDKAPHLLLASKSLPGFIIPECLKLLPSNEKFTIVAVTKFWTKFINNRKYSQSDLMTMQNLIGLNGQQLTYQTMYGLYHTQRSDLNSYTDLIRGLVAKFPMDTKNWLVSALPQICDKPSIHENFVNRLFVTRGSRAAANVILNWWLECTALPSY